MTRAKGGDSPRAYRALRAAALGLVAPVGAGVAVATVVGFLGQTSPVLDLASHFRMWYLVALVPVVAASAALRDRQSTGLSAAALVANLVVMAPLYIPSGQLSSPRDQTVALNIIQFNVQTANTRRAEVAAYVDESRADLVFLQEVDSGWLEMLGSEAQKLSVVEGVPRDDNFGIAVLAGRSSSPYLQVAESEVVALVADRPDRPAIEMEVRWQGESIHVLTLHTMPPKGLAGWDLRDEQLAAVRHWMDSGHGPRLVVGDLNATRWSAPFRQLVGETSLRNTELGFGYQGTWRADWPWLFRLPIDHVLATEHFAVSEREDGPSLGSDHRPLRVSLVWNYD